MSSRYAMDLAEQLKERERELCEVHEVLAAAKADNERLRELLAEGINNVKFLLGSAAAQSEGATLRGLSVLKQWADNAKGR